MQIKFSKYHGAGNDFIILENRDKKYAKLTTSQIALLCNRHFGIGADGLIKISKVRNADFEMEYFNADGDAGSMCGNGARCAVMFVYLSGMKKKKFAFTAYDGDHTAIMHSINKLQGIVSVSMKTVEKILQTREDFILNTGSPHYVRFVKKLDEMDVFAEGRGIRNSVPFKRDGINVNFIELRKNDLFIRTYERGVEDETLACGTGITAAAIAAYHSDKIKKHPVTVHARGGSLSVNFDVGMNQYSNVILKGPAAMVYSGEFRM